MKRDTMREKVTITLNHEAAISLTGVLTRLFKESSTTIAGGILAAVANQLSHKLVEGEPQDLEAFLTALEPLVASVELQPKALARTGTTKSALSASQLKTLGKMTVEGVWPLVALAKVTGIPARVASWQDLYGKIPQDDWSVGASLFAQAEDKQAMLDSFFGEGVAHYVQERTSASWRVSGTSGAA